MKSLLISCMKLPPARRPEAFRSLGSVLNFTPEDYDLVSIISLYQRLLSTYS